MGKAKIGRIARYVFNAALYMAMAVCVLAFSMGVHDSLSAQGTTMPRTEANNAIPFNSTLFFVLMAAPVIVSVGVAAVFYGLQMYRASSGTRNRGWEELL